MEPNALLLAGILFALKHFIFDSLLQYPFHYMNKGNMLHPGGHAHAALHASGTLLALIPTVLLFNLPASIGLIFSAALLDYLVHFWVDWSKVNITKKYNWSEYVLPTDTKSGYLKINSNNYFHALIADQCLHFATYIFLIWMVL